MNQHLQSILNFIQSNESLTDEEKSVLLKSIENAGEELEVAVSELARTKKLKKINAALLKKAIKELEHKRKEVEVQNRDLEIEAALEKVRSRSLAMHKTDELKDVVNVVFEKLVELNILKEEIASIFIFKEGSKDIEQWAAAPGLFSSASHFHLPYFDQPINNEFLQARESGTEFFTKTISFEEKNKMFEWLFEHSDYKYLADDSKKWLLETETFTRLDVFAKNSSIFIPSYTKQLLSEDEINTLKRFAKVFDQAYTRFLDLQKAEAQAREAQIEAALEKVRAKVMAMNSSKDLNETSLVFGEQLRKLGIDWQLSYFWLIEEDKDENTFWITWPDNKTSTTTYSLAEADESFKECIIAWQQQVKIHSTHVPVQDVQALLDTFERITNDAGGVAVEIMQPDNFKNGVYYYDAMIRFGSFGILMNRAVNDEEKIIQSRFATEFERAYTRFLDLQKAEAQAREAQIELGLERVRAKAMAMQKSDDLAQAVAIIFEELDKLNIGILRCGIGILNKENRSVNVWTTSKSGENAPVQISGDESMDSHPLLQGAFDAWLKQEDYSYTLQGKDLTDYYKAQAAANFKLPESQSLVESNEDICQYYFLSTFQAGGLFAFRETSFSEEGKKLMKRFANVFNLTYKRFLDLQTAEAQARESQIQLALERVRARTMAMQHSDELAETASLLFKQINDLGIQTWTSGFNIWEKDDTSFIGYNPTPSGGITAPYHIPSTEDSFFIKIHEAKKRGGDFIVFESTGDSLAATYRYMKTLPIVKDVLKSIEDSGFQLPKFQINHCTFFAQGFLLFITLEPYPEAHDIFKRFGIVFEQTYTRFLDLQKAEAQAREAEIELALERVRARTMAMQKSDELQEVVHTVLERLKELSIDFYTAIIILFKEDSKDIIWWLENKEKQQHPRILIPYANISYLRDLFAAKESGNELLSKCYFAEEKHQLYRHLFEYTDLKYVPENQKKFLSENEFATISVALEKNTAIHITSYSRKSFSNKDNEILKRFARVFEQAYTRFLDLQKAEAQSREAQIELGLERVRSRAMAMQRSDELKELIGTVSAELGKLDIILDRCFIITYDTQTMGSTWWMANPETPTEPIGLLVKYHEDLPYLAHIEAWKERKVKWEYILEGEVKRTWDKFLFIETELSQLPAFVIENMRSKEKVYLSSSFNNFGYLTLATLEPLAGEQFDIMLRFAKVFDLTYTRFNDLKQAEAQAREAQIELGLERVRARVRARAKK